MKTKPKVKTKPVQAPVKQRKGFAVIAPARRIEIARMGGRKVSRNREHMRFIGAMGGRHTQRNWKRIAKTAKG